MVPESDGVNRYVANGSTDEFAYTFKIASNTEIEVLLDSAVKTLGVDYTVSGVGDSDGGAVTFLSDPAADTIVTLLRKQTASQVSVYSPAEAFPSVRVSNDFDKVVMHVQQLKEVLERCVRAPKQDIDPLDALPAKAVRALKFLGFDADGQLTTATGIPETALSVSAFMETLLDDASADDALNTLITGATSHGANYALADQIPYRDVSANDGGRMTVERLADFIAGTVSALAYADLDAAITDIGANVRTLLITGAAFAATDNVTVPSNITLWFAGPGVLNVPVTKTVTINGPIIAPPRQIFDGAGTVLIDEGTTRQTVWFDSGVPAGISGENLLYDYPNGGDSDNVLEMDGTRGGYFADYNCLAKRILIGQFDEDQSAISGGGFRDLLFLDAVDTDNVDYTLIGQKVTAGIRSYVQGLHNGTAYQSMYKDLVGGSFAALGNIQWAERGCSGITAEAWQYGIGIASNEMAVNNPAAANGGVAQSESLAAMQAIIRSQFDDEDGTHLSRGIIIQNIGLRVTAALDILSTNGGGSFTSHYKYGIKMNSAIINDAAIVMSTDGAGASIIQYDTNDYSSYDAAGNRFNWTIGATTVFSIKATSLVIAETANGSPVEGDFWYDGTNLKFQDGVGTKTLTWS